MLRQLLLARVYLTSDDGRDRLASRRLVAKYFASPPILTLLCGLALCTLDSWSPFAVVGFRARPFLVRSAAEAAVSLVHSLRTVPILRPGTVNPYRPRRRIRGS